MDIWGNTLMGWVSTDSAPYQEGRLGRLGLADLRWP